MKRMSKHIIRIIALFMAFALIGSALISVLAEDQKLEVMIISEETEKKTTKLFPKILRDMNSYQGIETAFL